MLWCSDCKTLLDESDLNFRKSELEDSKYPWEMVAQCPYCGNEALEDAGTCEICGDPCAPGEYYCEDCEDKLYHAVDDLILKLGGDYIDTKEKLFDYLERRWF